MNIRAFPAFLQERRELRVAHLPNHQRPRDGRDVGDGSQIVILAASTNLALASVG